MIRLCAFSDEASDSLEGQIAALLRNNIKLTELRSVGGVNVKDFTNEQAEAYAKQLAESGIRRRVGVIHFNAVDIGINGRADDLKLHAMGFVGIFKRNDMADPPIPNRSDSPPKRAAAV